MCHCVRHCYGSTVIYYKPYHVIYLSVQGQCIKFTGRHVTVCKMCFGKDATPFVAVKVTELYMYSMCLDSRNSKGGIF